MGLAPGLSSAYDPDPDPGFSKGVAEVMPGLVLHRRERGGPEALPLCAVWTVLSGVWMFFFIILFHCSFIMVLLLQISLYTLFQFVCDWSSQFCCMQSSLWGNYGWCIIFNFLSMFSPYSWDLFACRDFCWLGLLFSLHASYFIILILVFGAIFGSVDPYPYWLCCLYLDGQCWWFCLSSLWLCIFSYFGAYLLMLYWVEWWGSLGDGLCSPYVFSWWFNRAHVISHISNYHLRRCKGWK